VIFRWRSVVWRLWGGLFRTLHPWLPVNDTRALVEASATMLEQHPVGEAPATVGSVLYHHGKGHCEGAVIVSPWGCGPARPIGMSSPGCAGGKTPSVHTSGQARASDKPGAVQPKLLWRADRGT